MPIEYSMLYGRPVPIKRCPRCWAEPLEPFLRGLVQRRRRRWFLFGEEWPYCAIICGECKNIVGHEDPLTGEFEEEI